MSEYRVSIVVDVDAESPEQAAQEALSVQRERAASIVEVRRLEDDGSLGAPRDVAVIDHPAPVSDD